MLVALIARHEGDIDNLNAIEMERRLVRPPFDLLLQCDAIAHLLREIGNPDGLPAQLDLALAVHAIGDRVVVVDRQEVGHRLDVVRGAERAIRVSGHCGCASGEGIELNGARSTT